MINDKLNAKDNPPKCLDKRLQGNFVNNNVANFYRRNLSGFKISSLSKRLNFVPTSNTMDKVNFENGIRGTWQNVMIKVAFQK